MVHKTNSEITEYLKTVVLCLGAAFRIWIRIEMGLHWVRSRTGTENTDSDPGQCK